MRGRTFLVMVVLALISVNANAAETFTTRLSAQFCQGYQPADRDRIWYNSLGVANDSTTSDALVYCPFSFQNSGYYLDADVENITLSVLDNGGTFSCRAYVRKYDGSYYASATINSSEPGYNPITFEDPFNGGSTIPWQLKGYTVRCYIPKKISLKSYILGYSSNLTLDP